MSTLHSVCSGGNAPSGIWSLIPYPFHSIVWARLLVMMKRASATVSNPGRYSTWKMYNEKLHKHNMPMMHWSCTFVFWMPMCSVWPCVMYARVFCMPVCSVCPCVLYARVFYMPVCYVCPCVMYAHVLCMPMCYVCQCVMYAVHYVCPCVLFIACENFIMIVYYCNYSNTTQASKIIRLWPFVD